MVIGHDLLSLQGCANMNLFIGNTVSQYHKQCISVVIIRSEFTYSEIKKVGSIARCFCNSVLIFIFVT